MKTTVETLENNKVKVNVVFDAKEVDARIKATYKDFAYKYNFPGFRKGKAPRPVIDNALGAEAIRASVTDDLINGSYPDILEQEKLYPVSKPEAAQNDGMVEQGKDFEFSFTLTVKPEYELSSYEAVEIELPSEEATEEEIDEQVEALREHYFDFQDANANTKIKEDSTVELAMKATDDAGEAIDSLTSEERLYTLGTGLLPKVFDEELVGLKKGQKKEFSIDIAGNDAILLTSLAGKTTKVQFEVEVKVVKKKVMPEINDEWAQKSLGFNDLNDLRARIAESIKQQKGEMLPRLKEDACLAVLAERLQGEVPEAMANESEASLLQGFFTQLQRSGMSFDAYLAQQNMSADQFKDDVKKQAQDVAKQDLALDAWARHFGMEATDSDISDEFVKSGAEDPKALEADWRKNGQLYLVREGILRSKAALDVMEKAVVSELKPEKPAKKATKKSTKKTSSKKSEEKTEE